MTAPNDPTISSKNYEDKGGDRMVVRGELSISGILTGADGAQAAAIPDLASGATVTASDYNALLALLRNIGAIASA